MKVLLRRTEVTDESLRLPRPKFTQEVLCVGSEQECREMLDKIAHLPHNKSVDGIDVTLYITKWQKQKTHTSQTFTINNGKRNTDSVARNASVSNTRSPSRKRKNGKRGLAKLERGGQDARGNAGSEASNDDPC